jgi:hypothetical protein
VPVFVAINFLMALVKLYALVTIREQKWIREYYQPNKRSGRTHAAIQRIKDIILTTEVLSCLVLFVFYVLR